MITFPIAHFSNEMKRIRAFTVLLSTLVVTMAVTGCGPTRATPTFPLKSGWYYLGPQPTEQQKAVALARMVDGASDQRVVKATGERYDFYSPAVVFLEEDDGVLCQREPNRIMMAAGHAKMQMLGHEAGVLVTVDGSKVMLGDGTYLFQLDTFSKRPLYSNPAYFGEQAESGIVTFTARLDPGGEWYVPAINNAKIPIKDTLVLISKDRLGKQP
jgi:hypothetical protein